jgi:hypothetical protein
MQPATPKKRFAGCFNRVDRWPGRQKLRQHNIKLLINLFETGAGV